MRLQAPRPLPGQAGARVRRRGPAGTPVGNYSQRGSRCQAGAAATGAPGILLPRLRRRVEVGGPGWEGTLSPAVAEGSPSYTWGAIAPGASRFRFPNVVLERAP